MEVIRTKQFHIDEPTAVAMGKFDSLHLGHKVILDRLKREAECSLRTVVVAFDPGPEVFFGKYEGGFVLTAEEKKQLLEKAGIDYYILYPFDSETAGTEAEDSHLPISRNSSRMRMQSVHSPCRLKSLSKTQPYVSFWATPLHGFWLTRN